MPAEPQPYFAPLSSGHPAGLTQHDRIAASEIAACEQMDRDRAYGRPHVAPPTVLQIREPVLPDDFRQKVSELDKQISERGIGISKERLLSLGRDSRRERFPRFY